MAELVGLAASLTTLLQVAGQIAQLSYAYVSDVRNAPKVQKRYLQEVSAFMDVLFRAEQAIAESEAIDGVPPRPASLTNAVIQECLTQLQSLHTQLQKRTQRLLWPFQSRELEKSIGILSRFRSIFADFVSATSLLATTATYKKVEIMSLQQDKQQILTWLEAEGRLQRAPPQPHPGTGDWFLQHRDYMTWRDGNLKELWCCGPPGVGKSHLASKAIIDLQARRKESWNILSFFADFSDRDRNTNLSIFQSFLRQIIEQGDRTVIESVKDTGTNDPSKLHELDGICKIIAGLCSNKTTYIVLDAPDELQRPDELLIQLKALTTSACNILITSREMPEVKRRFRSATRLDVGTNIEDVRVHIRARFNDSEFSDELGNAEDLVDQIVATSGNSFLLAKLMLDQMLEHSTIRKMRKSLETPPQSIQEAYKANLLRIDAQPGSKRSLARRLLYWITHAKRRLTTNEMIEAFAVEDDLDEIDPENILTFDRMLAPCVGLVTVDPGDQTLRLIHTTAYEFFQKYCENLREMKLDIARTSLLYLSLKPFQSGACITVDDLKLRFATMRFLDYSVRFLGAHMSEEIVQSELASSTIALLRSAELRASMFQALQSRPNLSSGLAEDFVQSIPTGVSALHVAACFNLTVAMTELLTAGESVTGLDSQQWTPLHYACSRGHEEVAKLLIQADSPLDARDSQGWTPLFWASFTGSVGIVKLLLDNGANHLILSTLGWSALHWAVSRGEEEIVTLLLKHHQSRTTLAAVPRRKVASLAYTDAVEYLDSARPEATLSALEIAAETGHEEVFDALVDQCDASIDLHDETFNKIWAAQKFTYPVSNPWRTLTKGDAIRERIVRERCRVRYDEDSATYLSMELPGNLSEKPFWRSKLLLSAINDGQLTAARLLIESGADINFNCSTTPLHASASQKDPAFCQMLLAAGVDTSARDQRGYTALHHAVMNGYRSTVQLLAEAGADVNARVDAQDPSLIKPFFTYGTRDVDSFIFPRKSHRATTRTSLILGCGVMLRKMDLGTATQSMIDLLLAKGADPNLQDKDGLTPLHYAAAAPEPTIINSLLTAGANPNIVDHCGRSPLHFLAKFARLDCSIEVTRDVIDRILASSGQVDKHLYINAQTTDHTEQLEIDYLYGDWGTDDAGLTPVAYALKQGRWTVFDALIERGGVLPSTIDLNTILQDALWQLQVDKVEQMLALGAIPLPSAIRDLTVALFTSKYGDYRRIPEDRPTQIHSRYWTVTPESLDILAFDAMVPVLVKSECVSIDWQEPESGVSATHLAARKHSARGTLQTLLKSAADPTVEIHGGFDATILAALYQNSGQMQDLLVHLAAQNKPDHWSKHLVGIQDHKSDYHLLCRALQKQAMLDRRFIGGATLLHLASELENVALVEALQMCGANECATDDKGLLALHYAAFAEAWDIVDALWPRFLVAGCPLDRNLPSRGNLAAEYTFTQQEGRIEHMTLFHCAALSNRAHIVAELLNKGVAIDDECERPSKSSGSPLYLAAGMGHTDVISLLITRGANVQWSSKHGWSSIHIAALNGHEHVVRMLIDAGADVKATTLNWGEQYPYPSGIYCGNQWKGQPLHLAALQGHVGVVKLLLQHGADVNATTGTYGSPYYSNNEVTGLSCGPMALHNALATGTLHGRNGECLDRNRLLVARMLIDAGAKVDGVADYLNVQHVLCFEEFEDVWDAVRKGVSKEGKAL